MYIHVLSLVCRGTASVHLVLSVTFVMGREYLALAVPSVWLIFVYCQVHCHYCCLQSLIHHHHLISVTCASSSMIINYQ